MLTEEQRLAKSQYIENRIDQGQHVKTDEMTWLGWYRTTDEYASTSSVDASIEPEAAPGVADDAA